MKKKILICLLAAVMALSLIVAVACNKENIKGEFEWDVAKTTGGVEIGNAEKVMPTDIPESAAEPSLMIHYYRKQASEYKTWGFWLWADGAEGVLYNIQYQDDVYGSVTIVALSTLGVTSTGKVGIIARLQSGWTKDTEADRYIALSDYTMDSNNYYHVYLYQGDGNLYKDIESLQHGMTATFVDDKHVEIITKANVTHVELLEGETIVGKADTEQTRSIRFNFDDKHEPDITQLYTVKVTFADGTEATCDVSITALFETELFATSFNYDGELGAIYSSTQTQFKVWSPISGRIVLNIYEAGDGAETPQTYEMTKGDKGVFEYTLAGDQAGKYYTYTVYNTTYPTGAEIVDPYAKSAGLNGRRGMIVNFGLTNPDGWSNVSAHDYDANELVVWETHVADVTSSATWTGTEAYRKKFLGMTEAGTKYTNGGTTVSTGFDHIKELGVNAVQLVPIFDQANDEVNVSFNWGYNPLNYNVLEGAYSTDASDGYVRIKEFKQLVKAYNEAGINIIMDVVYNHVNSAIASNFDVLMPGYYFRYSTSGDMSNGSGCGNETASNHYMFRKFMIDSACFWASEYKLGGFRFDLMGLHDIDTMNALAAALKQINPSIVIYGEPWTGGGTTLASRNQAKQDNANKFEGYGQFNDQMRDALIMGGMKAATEKGWITQNDLNSLVATDITKITSGLQGITNTGVLQIKDLYKTVNYVTCHDNYTLKDRIRAAGITNAATVKSMAMLANSVVLTSNGVNFMLAGEEFLRSKQDNGATGDEIHNSYESSYKVNELNYQLKINNADMFANYQKLIAFKKMFVKDFALTSNEQVAANYKVESIGSGSAFLITITAKNGTVWKVVHANGAVGSTKEPTTVDFAGYTLYLDTLGVGGLTLSDATELAPYQTIIASK